MSWYADSSWAYHSCYGSSSWFLCLAKILGILISSFFAVSVRHAHGGFLLGPQEVTGQFEPKRNSKCWPPVQFHDRVVDFSAELQRLSPKCVGAGRASIFSRSWSFCPLSGTSFLKHVDFAETLDAAPVFSSFFKIFHAGKNLPCWQQGLLQNSFSHDT